MVLVHPDCSPGVLLDQSAFFSLRELVTISFTSRACCRQRACQAESARAIAGQMDTAHAWQASYNAKACIVDADCGIFKPSRTSERTCECGHRVSLHLLHSKCRSKPAQQLFAAIRNTRCVAALIAAEHGAEQCVSGKRGLDDLADACSGLCGAMGRALAALASLKSHNLQSSSLLNLQEQCKARCQ